MKFFISNSFFAFINGQQCECYFRFLISMKILIIKLDNNIAILFIIASRATDNQFTSELNSPNKIGPYCKPSSS